ncbi:MAG: nucleotidyltransferase domain-containing protein [Actinomycetes bacterium]
MDLSRPLAVLTPTADADVLAVLARAEAAFTPGELHRLLNRYSEAGVRKCLARLTDQGIVRGERAGNAYLYSLNRDHLAAEHVVALARLRDTLLAGITRRLRSWPVTPAFAALFGSAARGDMSPHSDIDLLLVRPARTVADDEAWRAGVEELTHDMAQWTGNDVRVLEYGRDEARSAAAAGDPVLDSIRREGVPLHGSDRILRHRERPEGPA